MAHRVTNPDRPAFEDYRSFKIFGPSIIATNEKSHGIMESRGVLINMPKSERVFEENVTEEGCLVLKERLVAFRARHLGNPLLTIQKPSLGRLGDILQPICQILMTVIPEREDKFMELIVRLEEEQMMEKVGTLEARIIAALIDLDPKVDKGTLTVKEITDLVNEGVEEKYRHSPDRIGKRLSALGFQKTKVEGRFRAIIYDAKKVRIMGGYTVLKKWSKCPKRRKAPYFKLNLGTLGHLGHFFGGVSPPLGPLPTPVHTHRDWVF
jgi:hypothetical protein